MAKIVPFKKKLDQVVDLDNIYEVTRFLQDLILHDPLPYSQIAGKIGMSASTVSRMAEGVTKDPRIGTVMRLLKHYGYKVYAAKT